jgi:hypothetical protein
VSRQKSGAAYEFRTITFRNVRAAAITDTLTAAITSVNGVAAKAAGERSYIGIAALPVDDILRDYESITWWNGGFEIGAYQGTPTEYILPREHRSGPYVWLEQTGTSVTIPDGVTAIGDKAFYNMYHLSSVTIPGGVTAIGREAFLYCHLRSIIIPNGVTAIGSRAFWSNPMWLTSVTIPDSVTSIGGQAFSCFDGNKLTSVTIPANVEVGERAFDKYNTAVRRRFETLYNSNGKRAGTYIRKGGKWEYQH